MKHVQTMKTKLNTKSSKFLLLAMASLASVSVSATEVDSEFYGSLRLGADYVESGTADDAVNGRDYLSRVGVKANVQLTDGLVGLGKVECGFVVMMA